MVWSGLLPPCLLAALAASAKSAGHTAVAAVRPHFDLAIDSSLPERRQDAGEDPCGGIPAELGFEDLADAGKRHRIDRDDLHRNGGTFGRALADPGLELARRYLLAVESRVARGLVGIPEPAPPPPMLHGCLLKVARGVSATLMNWLSLPTSSIWSTIDRHTRPFAGSSGLLGSPLMPPSAALTSLKD